MRMPLRTLLAAVAVAAAALFPFGVALAKVDVQLELAQEFYYAGDSLSVRISVRNSGQKQLGNPIKTPLLEGFKIRSGNQALEATGKPRFDEPARPDKLAPQSFYGGVVNLVDLYPQLSRAGKYEIYWSADGVVSDMLVVTIIPRYDPGKQYTGEIETNFGSILIEFYQKESPLAVKSFVDLAHAGFYDDLQFHEVLADSYIVGGDPRFANPPRRSINYPAEQSALPLVAGTVVMQPTGAAPPANGSAFVIVLKPRPAWTGQVTVVGQVIRGLDIVQEISRVPSTMRTSKPNFKPLQEVKIKTVRIEEKAPSAAGS